MCQEPTSVRPGFQSPEEAKAVVGGSIAYFGKYSVDESGKVVSIDIQGSTFCQSNWQHCRQQEKRYVSYRKRMKLTNPGSASGLTLDASLPAPASVLERQI
jgi:hypothetical protein